jgi:PAS domain S-box-containing protein
VDLAYCGWGILTLVIVSLSWFFANESKRRRQQELAAHAEESVREQKVLLDAALQNMSQGLCMFDADGGIVLFNERYAAMMDMPAASLKGISLLDLLHRYRRAAGEDTADAEQVFANVLAEAREGKSSTKAIKTSAGRTLHVIDQPMEKGGWVSTFEDITEQLKAEAAIREYAEREQLFIAAVESANDAIVTETLDGVITGWNQAAEHFFGFSSQEAIGERIDIVVPDELRDEARGFLAKIKNNEKVDHHETVRTTKDGRRIDVSLSVSSLKSPSGEIIGAVKVTRDISAKKKAQEALLESEQMARAIIDTALDAFLQLDKNGTVIGWSPKAEAMFGWSHQEVVGQKLRDFAIPAENRETYSERIAQFLRDAENGTVGRRYEAQSQRRDGKRIDTEISLTALRRRDGHVINCFIRDITERVAAEEQLKQAQKMESIGQLTGRVAHDFNNLLTVIIGNLDLLRDDVAGHPAAEEKIDVILHASERGADLTRHMLAFSRRQPLNPKPVDVNALVENMTRMLSRTLGGSVAVEVHTAADPLTALVDASQLETALLNIALNARDAMPDGGALTISTRVAELDEDYAALHQGVKPGTYAAIEIADSGTGIPPDLLERIFEPFFTTKPAGKGTGLGLSMVYGFIKQSGGHINAYSEIGRGTVFKLFLPPARPAARIEAIESNGPRAAKLGGNEVILAVDDNPDIRAAVTAQLRSLGYQVREADSAHAALQILDAAERIDLLFTDMIMPGGLNGKELATKARAKRADLKVLFTSGFPGTSGRHGAQLEPGDVLLSKPYHKHDLAKAIQQVMSAAA